MSITLSIVAFFALYSLITAAINTAFFEETFPSEDLRETSVAMTYITYPIVALFIMLLMFRLPKTNVYFSSYTYLVFAFTIAYVGTLTYYFNADAPSKDVTRASQIMSYGSGLVALGTLVLLLVGRNDIDSGSSTS